MQPNYNNHNQKLYWDKNVHAFSGQHNGKVRSDKIDKMRTIN